MEQHYKEHHAYAYWLTTRQGIGYQKRQYLLQHYGTVQEIYEANLRELETVPLFRTKDLLQLQNKPGPERLLEDLEQLWQRGIRFCWQGEDCYPERLRHIEEPPFTLFYRGHLPREDRPIVAIVGGRNASYEGREIARNFGRQLAENGIQIVSGLARGIDIAAQRGTLELPGGQTYAVLGTGIDQCYPRQHIEEYIQMQNKGGVLSEYAPGTYGHPGNFAKRNRIISGLADGVLVIEARKGSGSLITASCALEQGKEIFVVPGSIVNRSYEGGNELLKSGGMVVTNARDVMDGLGIFVDTDLSAQKKKNKVMLETAEKIVYAMLGFDGIHISEIVAKTGLAVPKVMEIVLSLENKGLIADVGQHHYALKLKD